MMDEKYDNDRAADYLGVKKGTLPIWRSTKRHPQPAYYKVGSKVVYLKRDLDAYLEVVRVTSEAV